MITWPVTIKGILSPAFGIDLYQYEFKCRNGNVNKLKLPSMDISVFESHQYGIC
jgi:hypothetical protein